MSANSWGHCFHTTSFGESHGPALGVVIEGCPSGVLWDQKLLVSQLNRRKPGTHPWLSSRKEEDAPEVLSGVFQNKTLGTPIALIAFNHDARSKDYENLKPRRGHADSIFKKKYTHVDPRGGGRSSGRETLSRVMAGSVAQMFVQQVSKNTKIQSSLKQVGPLKTFSQKDLENFLIEAKERSESYGGVAEVTIQNPPACLGQPVFKKLKSDLASAMMSLGASFCFELADGFSSLSEKGSVFHSPSRHQNPYGGLHGGISTGEPLTFQVGFKPTSSILDVAKKGRHDPCIVPRALVVLEAMAWLTLADHLLWARLDNVGTLNL